MAYNNPQLLKILAVIARKPGNNQCADCSMPNPTWASFNLGMFICMNCSGVHRMLGTHITRIRSITLDHWDDTGVQTMAQTGNRLANMYWEAKLPPGQKINANSDENTRTRFIRAKYEQRLWYGQPSAEAIEANASIGQVSAAASHHPDEAGMTREQKIAFRQQRMNGGVTSPPITNSNQSAAQSARPPQASYTPQPTHQAPAAFTEASHHSHAQPQLRHATSLPQISQHSSMPNRSFNQAASHSTNADDLFAGLTPKVNVQSSQPPAQSSQSPPPVQQRPKRITGASPWVQRPAGTEPNYAINQSVPQSNQSNFSAANYYANMAADNQSNHHIVAPVPVAAAPIDLMNFADPSPAAATAPSAGFDFLGSDDQTSSQSNTQSYGAPGGFDIHNAQSSPSDAAVNAVDRSMSAFSFFDSSQPQQSEDQSSYQQSSPQADYQSQYQQSPPPTQQQHQPHQQQYAPQQSPQYAQQTHQVEQHHVAPAQSEPSGFDFVSESSADQTVHQSNDAGYGFDFVNDSTPAATSSASNKPHKSRVTADVFGDLVPESDAALPELEPLGDIQRKASSDGLLASLSAPSHSMPAPVGHPHPAHHAYPPQAYGYPPQAAHHPEFASPPGPQYGQYPPQHNAYYPPTGAPGYAYPPYTASSATH